MSDKSLILAQLIRQKLPHKVLEFDEVLTDVAEAALGKTRIDAERFTKAHAKKYWNWISQEIDADLDAGIFPYFSLTDPGLRKFESQPSFLAKSQASKEQRLGKLLQSRSDIHLAIDSLSDREYEALSCVVCEEIGSIQVHLTPPGNEGGIDFVAILKVSGKSHVFGGTRGALRIIGQCKQYAQPVQVDRVDQFVKTVNDVRHRSPRVDPHLPAWFHSSTAPIVGWIIAHSGFQGGAKDEAKQHGIALSSSRDLVEILSTSRSFHPYESSAIRAKKLCEQVKSTLAQAQAGTPAGSP